MWLDRYNTMSSIDKERFSELTNELLNKKDTLVMHTIVIGELKWTKKKF